jgi:hypothetical protein
MQINKNNKSDNKICRRENIETKRDLELENIAGNLMIAEYRVDKLRNRLSQQVIGTVHHSFSKIKTSAHTFKYDGKWYKLSIKVEELSLDSNSSNNNSVKSQN